MAELRHHLHMKTLPGVLVAKLNHIKRSSFNICAYGAYGLVYKREIFTQNQIIKD